MLTADLKTRSIYCEYVNQIRIKRMTTLIEDQMHQFLIAQEEARCSALEEKYKNNEATKDKKVKRKDISKPWTRSGRDSLCQENELLILVSEYNYDLSNKNFQDYCKDRGILSVAGKSGSKRWDFFLNYKKLKGSFSIDPYFQYAEEVDGKKYRYSDWELEIQWKIILLGRAKLQDCWEIFSSKVNMEK